MSKNKLFNMLVVMIVSLFVAGCDDAKLGADELADEVTGKKKIEQKIETEKKIDSLVDEANKNHQDALDSIDK